MVETQKAPNLTQDAKDVFSALRWHGHAVPAASGLLSDPVRSFLSNEWVKAHTSVGAALSAVEYVERLVELANGGKMPIARFWELATGARLPGRPAPRVGFIQEPLLNALRERLSILVGREPGYQARVDWLSAELANELDGKIVLVPKFSPRGNVRYLTFAVDTEDAINYALTRAIDPSTGLRNRLCRCRFRECGRFFLVERENDRGRIRRDYCPGRDDHREEEQRLQAIERAQRSRARRKEETPKSPRKHK